MSTRWIVATGLSGDTNARRENPHGHFTAGISSSCVISKFFFVFFGAAGAVARGFMARAEFRQNEQNKSNGSTSLSYLHSVHSVYFVSFFRERPRRDFPSPSSFLSGYFDPLAF